MCVCAWVANRGCVYKKLIPRIMVVMGGDEGREVLVIVIVIRLLYYHTIGVMFGVQLSICILIRNVILSVGFYLQISNKMYYLFFLLFLFVLEYISVHHNLPCCS